MPKVIFDAFENGAGLGIVEHPTLDLNTDRGPCGRVDMEQADMMHAKVAMLTVAFRSAVLLGVVGLLGCHHPIVGKPAIVGASASSGVGATIPATGHDADGPKVPVDLEASYDVVVRARHQQPVNFSSGLHFRDPTESTRNQLANAKRINPTIYIAIDLLFWSAHMPVEEEHLGTEEETRQRMASLQEVLQQLEPIEVPIVLGYVPPIDHTLIEFIDANRVPSRALLAEINTEIEKWAADHPNVILIEFGAFVEAVYAERPTEILGNRFDGTQMRGLIQDDNLHPTAKGLVVLMQLACEELEARGLIEMVDWHRSTDLAMAFLPLKAEIAASQEFGFFGLLGLIRARDRIDAAFDAGECDEAFRILDGVLEEFASFAEEPDEWDMISTGYMFLLWTEACREEIARAQIRQVDRLTPEVASRLPNEWKFTLWRDAMGKLGRSDLVVERLVRMRGEIGAYPDSYRALAERYLNRANAWIRYPEMTSSLFPEEEQLDVMVEYRARKYDVLDPFTDEDSFLQPITDESFDSQMRTWDISNRMTIKSVRKPTRADMEWSEKSKSYGMFLRDQVDLCVGLAHGGQLEMARELLRRSIDRVGGRFYNVWLEESRREPLDRTHPLYICSAYPIPNMGEISGWIPGEQAVVVTEDAD